jgi:hypothetical protein
MDELSIDCAQRLEAMARELSLLAQRLTGSRESPPAPAPPDVSQKVKENRCLFCDKVVKSPEQYRRGLCVAHYQKIVTGAIGSGRVTEGDMIIKGWLLPPKKPGKQSDDQRLEEFIEQKKLGEYAAKRGEATANVIHAAALTPPPGPKKKPPKK